jgi:hypothetical protein
MHMMINLGHDGDHPAHGDRRTVCPPTIMTNISSGRAWPDSPREFLGCAPLSRFWSGELEVKLSLDRIPRV